MTHTGEDKEPTQMDAGDVQDSGGSAGSGLQSGLGHGKAAERDEEDAQEMEDKEEEEVEEGRKGRGMPSPVTVSKREREKSMN